MHRGALPFAFALALYLGGLGWAGVQVFADEPMTGRYLLLALCFAAGGVYGLWSEIVDIMADRKGWRRTVPHWLGLSEMLLIGLGITALGFLVSMGAS